MKGVDAVCRGCGAGLPPRKPGMCPEFLPEQPHCRLCGWPSEAGCEVVFCRAPADPGGKDPDPAARGGNSG
jgi:hypothetical protein